MKKGKRILSFLVALTMILSMAAMFPVTASAAYSAEDQNTIAKALKTLNLFEGYSATDFGLKDVPTREQALIFQIRALGEDAAARAWTGNSPYSDVANDHWARPYISYGAKMGYTTGVGNGKFGLGQPANAQMMATFVLRGLGYKDTGANPDFTYANSLSFAKSKGMVESNVEPRVFTRGDAASILFDSLPVLVKGTNYDLGSKLMNMGVFTQKQFDDAISILEGKTPAPTGNGPENGLYTIQFWGNTNQVFDVTNASTSDGANLILFKNGNQSNQQFYIEKVGSYYSIKAKHSGKAVTTPAGDGKGKGLVQSKYTGADSQLFQITIDSSGKALIMSKNGLYVGASEGKSQNGTYIILWTRSTKGSQDFKLKKVSTTPSTTVTEKTIKFVNKTGQTLTSFYASSYGDDDWGENLLDRSLANGSSVEIIFPIAKDDRYFDVRVDYKNTSFEFTKIDFSQFAKKGDVVNLEIKNGKPIMTKQSATPPQPTVTNKTITFVNKTGQALTSFYASSYGDDEWGSNLLDRSLANGGSVDIVFPVAKNDRYFDVRADYKNSSYEFTKIDFSQFATKGEVIVLEIKNGTPTMTKQSAIQTPPTTPVVEKTITFVNKTGQNLTSFYASSSGNNEWGSGLLDRSLANGQSVEIIFPVAKNDKLFDVRTDYTNGYYEFSRIDFSQFANKGEVIVLEVKNGTPTMTKKSDMPTQPTVTEKTVTFVNKTGQTLTSLYASSSGDADWGSSLLSGSLANGGSVDIIFPVAKDDKMFDIRTDYGSENYEFKGIDFSKFANSGSVVNIEIVNGTPTMTLQ